MTRPAFNLLPLTWFLRRLTPPVFKPPPPILSIPLPRPLLRAKGRRLLLRPGIKPEVLPQPLRAHPLPVALAQQVVFLERAELPGAAMVKHLLPVLVPAPAALELQ